MQGHPDLGGQVVRAPSDRSGTVGISEDGRAGRTLAALSMDPDGDLRDGGWQGAVLGHVDMGAGTITLTPAGEALVRCKAEEAGVPLAPPAAGSPGGAGPEAEPQRPGTPAAVRGAAETSAPSTTGAAQPALAPSAPPLADTGGNTGRLPPGPPGSVRQDGECDEDENMGPTSSKPHLPDPKTGAWRNANGSPGGPGNSLWFSNNKQVQAVTGGRGISFINGRPDFTPWAKLSINLPYGELTRTNYQDFAKVFKNMSRADPEMFRTAADAQRWVAQHKLTPHHATDTCIQLVPLGRNRAVPHIGSAADMRENPSAGGRQLNAKGQ